MELSDPDARDTVNINGKKNARIRIAIMTALKVEYPGAVDRKVLLFCMDTFGYPLTDEDLQRHIHYLEEKGLLATERKRGKGYDITHVAMTAKGWDHIDDIDPEKGIDDEL